MNKPLYEIGIISGFMIMAMPTFVGYPNGTILTSILGSGITLYSTFVYGCIVYKERKITTPER